MQEQRRFIRWQIDKEAKVKVIDTETFVSCQIKDINLKGAQISLPLKLLPDTFLNLKIFLSDECILGVEAHIVWYKPVDDFNVYGFYFAKIPESDKEKIYQFIRRNFPEQINKQWWKDTDRR